MKIIEKTILGILLVGIIALGSIFVSAVISDRSSSESVETQTHQLTAKEARAIALESVNTQVVGSITDVETEFSKGRTLYAIEFTKDGIETDVKIDAESGQIISIENDRDEVESEEEDSVSISEISDLGSRITEEDAKAIALQAVSGTITDIEIEREQGYIVYAVELDTSEGETDVKIDMETGKIIKIERDSEDED